MSTPPQLTPKYRRGAALALLGWLILCFAVAEVASIFSAHGAAWYSGLVKPRLNPPDGLFAVFWSALMCGLMAISAWLVGRTRPSSCRTRGLLLFLVQLWFNLLWSWIFFNQHQIATAFFDLVALWAALLLTIVNFRKVSRTAAWLLTPYLAWAAFAAYVNLKIWLLN
jgi:tryptophan-rich sensory protein